MATLATAEIDAIQESFVEVLSQPDRSADIFYTTLFDIAPETRPLFKNDMGSQGAKLIQTLALVVESLPRLESVLPTVQELARRHVAYGVRPEHYSPVGAALIAMLRRIVGRGFGSAEEEAWTRAYGVLSTVMIEAAEAR